jgi:hypothetical protein
MDLALQILIGVLCVPLTLLGVRCMFAPMGMLGELGLQSSGAVGLNTVRGMMGGLLLGSVAMLVLGLALHQTVWFLAVAVLMAAAAVGRLIGVGVDGFDRAVVPAIVVELVVVVVMVVAHMRWG